MGDLVVIQSIEGWTLWGESAEGELLIRDLDLAERLEFKRPRTIRDLIERHIAAKNLNDSEFRRTVRRTSDPLGRGRPGTEYWLTEAGALWIVAKSETPAAAALTKEIIRVYMLARHGQLPGQRAAAPRTIPEFGRAALAAIGAALDDGDQDTALRLHAALGALLTGQSPRPRWASPSRTPAAQQTLPLDDLPAHVEEKLADGLRAALSDLGMVEATATRLCHAVHSEPERFRLLRDALLAALGRLPPNSKVLGRLLGRFRGDVIKSRKLDGYTLWHPAPIEPPTFPPPADVALHQRERAAMAVVLRDWPRLDAMGRGLTIAKALEHLYPADSANQESRDLAAAFSVLAQGKPGQPPDARALGLVFRRYKGVPINGLVLDLTRLDRNGVARWTVTSTSLN